MKALTPPRQTRDARTPPAKATAAVLSQPKLSETELGQSTIICEATERDRYGRLLGICYLGELDLNGWLVRNGYALAYRRYSQRYVPQEIQAQKEGLGLWAGEFIPPWQWRAQTESVDEPASEPTEQKTNPDHPALLAVYGAAGGGGWIRNRNWNTSEPISEWEGVETGPDNRVTKLDLGNNNLSGTIAGEVGKLEKLRILYLDDNRLTGMIPSAELGTLSAIEILDLSDNTYLEGELPVSLMDTALTELDISGTGVCTPEDEGFRMWLLNLTFTSSENCGREEMEPAGKTKDREEKSGGCAVSPGGGYKEAAYRFTLIALAAAGVLSGAFGGFLKRRISGAAVRRSRDERQELSCG